MSDATQGVGDAKASTGAGRDHQLGVLLECFGGIKAAGKARRGLDGQLKSQGDSLLDTAVLRVSAKHKALAYDPRRVLLGTLTPALTWGVFGALTGTNRVQSAVIWAVIGAVCGGLYAYYTEHIGTKNELARIGAHLPAPSSALITYAETVDPRRLLRAAAAHQPAVASAAGIGTDLTARVFAGASEAIELPHSPASHAPPQDQASVLSMVMLRYPSPDTAKQIASQLTPKTKKTPGPLQVELVIRADRDGRRHVDAHKTGEGAYGVQAAIGWALFGVVFGAIAGATGGGGVLSAAKGALVTAVLWGIFGLVAGALYGLWAGRAVSDRRLKSVGPLLPPGTSMVVAWAGKPLTETTLDTVTTPGSQRLILRFNPVDGGAVLEAA